MITRHGALFAAVAASLWLGADGAFAEQSGIAAVYAYRGGRTASGEHSDPRRLTAAHRSLPFGTKVRVTNRNNGCNVVVRINDRGPLTRGRVIDLTPRPQASSGSAAWLG